MCVCATVKVISSDKNLRYNNGDKIKVGALTPFEPSKMQWTSYTERIEQYLVANSVNNARKKVAILLSSIGDATYKLLGDLCAPDKPNTKTFEELVEKFPAYIDSDFRTLQVPLEKSTDWRDCD